MAFTNRKIITAPTLIPVTLTEARAHLRIDDTTEDTLITTLITVATNYAEERTGRKLITQTWEIYLDDLPGDDYIDIPFGQLQSITHLKYYDVDDAEQTYASTNYYTDILSEPGKLKLKPTSAGWPSTYDRPNAVTVRFVCGYGTASTNIPEILRAAIKLLISHFFENREGVQTIGQVQDIPIPKAIDQLLNMYSIREQF